MIETQESISQWAEETFGPTGSNVRVAARANEEMAELLRCLSADENSPKAAEEAADVLIVLCRLAARLDYQFEIPAIGDPRGSHLQLAAEANKRMAEVCWLLAFDAPRWQVVECLYKVVRLLHHLAARMAFSLWDEVEKKMAINRSRVWQLDNTGHGYHVRDKANG